MHHYQCIVTDDTLRLLLLYILILKELEWERMIPKLFSDCCLPSAPCDFCIVGNMVCARGAMVTVASSGPPHTQGSGGSTMISV